MTEGWLADVDYHIVFDEAVKNVLEQDFNPQTLKELYELFNNQARNQAIATQIQDEMERIGLEHAKTIVFCQDIEQANEMAELLSGQAYHSDMQDDLQKKVLDSFRSNGLQVITTRDMFNEGVDVPDARLLIFLRSTGSKTIFEQQLGRGLRKHPGKDKVSVLDFVANIERLSLIKELVEGLSGRLNTTAGGGRDKATQPERLEHGLAIHTIHGDFDFDRISVQILTKLQSLKDVVTPWEDIGSNKVIELALTISPEAKLTDPDIYELSKKGDFPSTATIKRMFGSILRFQRACGFEVTNWQEKTDDDLVQLAKTLKTKEKLSALEITELSKSGLFPSVPTIKKRFGSIKNFQEACGYRVNRSGRHTKETAIQITKATLGEDVALSRQTMLKLSKVEGFPSENTIRRLFGSLGEFQKELGHDTESIKTKEKEQAISAALNISPENKLTAVAIKNLSEQGALPSPQRIKTLFGSIKAFQKACGFDV